jgi:hypothetical protein
MRKPGVPYYVMKEDQIMKLETIYQDINYKHLTNCTLLHVQPWEVLTV